MGIALAQKHAAVQQATLRQLLSLHYRSFLDLCFRKSKYFLIISDFSFLLFFLPLGIKTKTEIQLIGVVLLTILWAFITFFKKTYTQLLTEDAEIIIRRAFYHWLTFSAIAWILYPVLFKGAFDYRMYIASLFLLGVTVFSGRLLFLSFRKKYKHLLIRKHKIVLIGTNYHSMRFSKAIEHGLSEYEITGRYTKTDLKLFDTPDNPSCDIQRMASNGVKEIYCCTSALNGEEMHQLVRMADSHMIRVRFLPEDLPFAEQMRVQIINKVPVFVPRPEPLLSEKNKLIKRLFDVCFSLFVIVFILSWLTPVVWLCIWLDSRGPLFFKQKRTGIDNHSFYCLKYRSMVVDKHNSDTLQARRGDSRITRVGAFLRKTSIDELPQFINVLRGDMSVVGPRPHMLLHTDQYRKEIGTYMIRHFVKPGITGLAQINGYRGATEEINAMKQRVEHDIDYVENWTFMLDLKIIFLTMWNVVISDENAY